jgi:hypothetical protein
MNVESAIDIHALGLQNPSRYIALYRKEEAEGQR